MYINIKSKVYFIDAVHFPFTKENHFLHATTSESNSFNRVDFWFLTIIMFVSKLRVSLLDFEPTNDKWKHIIMKYTLKIIVAYSWFQSFVPSFVRSFVLLFLIFHNFLVNLILNPLYSSLSVYFVCVYVLSYIDRYSHFNRCCQCFNCILILISIETRVLSFFVGERSGWKILVIPKKNYITFFVQRLQRHLCIYAVGIFIFLGKLNLSQELSGREFNRLCLYSTLFIFPATFHFSTFHFNFPNQQNIFVQNENE